MNLNPFKRSAPRTEAPAPEPVSALVAAEEELHSASLDCTRLDQQKRDWAAQREAANRRYMSALTAYHVAREKSEVTN
jgi:hypothetical protein